ncbi:caldesmon isoform X2 [Myiozetetes cayanensis]|uniref:caldesmon isoform X2 n=1 Tax=Myiozetetes cayanensis TaxID=478635 RepID=UPI00215F47EF|nr:caldesmon isoform X2 [Myiozetetes cayanensis]
MDDFERRRELRRQKREEMRLEAERLSYQRNDDDDEEAARERRRRARQERLRQKEEGDLSGEVTEKSEVNAQNSVAGEETKRSTDDEAALLERLARREERRQKRLQEALERQKELDPTITDGSLSLPSRREVNNVEENETPGKEEKAETHRGHYEIEETEIVTKSYQRNNWRQDGEEQKKEEKDKEEVQEEKKMEVPIEENQIDMTAEKSADKEEVETKSLATNAEEHKAENDTNVVPEETPSLTDTLDKEKLRDEDKVEEERKEAEERERLKAEEEKRAAEEKQKADEEKRAAEERAKAEEEKRAAEERAKAEEEKRAAEERVKAEEEKRAAEERAKAEEEKRAAEERAKAEEEKRAAEERARLEAEKLKEKQKMEEQKIEDKQVKEMKVQEEKTQALRKQEEEKEVRVETKRAKLPEEKLQPTSRKDQIKDDKDKGKAPKEEMKSVWDHKKGVPEQKTQNGERELTAPKLKSTENAFGRSSLRGTTNAEELKPGFEALKRLEDQRRRRGENDNEELEKLKEKQQEAAAELDELKKRREERRKILEEEEQKKKQEEAERKVREEEEKKRMKEEIERRRAEAAEKRQKIPEDGVSEDKKPFKCFSPKGSSLKIEERTEFLNKSAQKSGMKPTQTTAVVSKIDSRLEQYTSAIEGTKASRPVKPAASDLHVAAEGVRNIKSMWEKGNVFSSPSGTATPNKETAGLKVGVSSRINEWLTKTPESSKSSAPKPSDLKPGDVSGKRNLWEKQSVDKPASSSKVSAMGKKSEANGLRQFEKEP